MTEAVEKLLNPNTALSEGVYADRVKNIKMRVLAMGAHIGSIETWLNDDVPQILLDKIAAHELRAALENLKEVLADNLTINPGPYTLEWVADTAKRLKRTNAATTKALLATDRMFRVFERMFSHSAPSPSPKKAGAHTGSYGLSLAAAADLHDLQWLARTQADLTLESSEADRSRRLRARRKQGFRMVTVGVHAEDINRLIQLGFLDREDKDDMSVVADALQSFHAAAFAAVNREDYATGKPPLMARRLNNGNRFWPLVRWMNRLAEFVQTSNPEPKLPKDEAREMEGNGDDD
jgi:hypothetical protein